MRKLTNLEHAILGLVGTGSQTGYAICQIFAETPMSGYSSSPGSIYPAIARLKSARLLTDPASESEDPPSLGLHLTSAGEKAVLSWLRTPLTPNEVERDMDAVLLRFAFMSGKLPLAEIQSFLTRLASELQAQAMRLAEYAGGEVDQLSPTGRLALSAGVARVRAYADWAQDACRLLAIDTRSAR